MAGCSQPAQTWLSASTFEANLYTEETSINRLIKHLLHRARGWILVGFAIIPGAISFPISFIYSTKALNRYNESGIKDVGLKKQILRIRFTSAIFTVLFWIAAVIYFFII